MEVEGEGCGGAGEGDVGEDGAECFVFGGFGDGSASEEGDEFKELLLEFFTVYSLRGSKLLFFFCFQLFNFCIKGILQRL